MIDSVKAVDNFSVLGHIDYIDRYIEDKTKIPDFKDYEDDDYKSDDEEYATYVKF